MTDVPTLLHHWFDEVWNKGRQEAIDELLAPDCIAHGLTDEHGNEVRGPAAFKAFHRNLLAGFSSFRVEVEDALVDGDRVAARCLVTGTQAGSGKPVRFTGMTMIRTKDGKITEGWNNYDFDVMRQQLS
ncbi:MAG TPA: ester cyclase [Stellaceae bacterium]|nr:ester cyclase [Stellaceae bacterium]